MDRDIRVTIGEVATCSSDGTRHGLVVGHGTSPEEAFAMLKAQAEKQGFPIIEERVNALLPYQRRPKEAGHWNLDFGVYDTRLTAGPTGEWIAYGTLTETGTLDIKAPPRRAFR
jgi:hypothetical protein